MGGEPVQNPPALLDIVPWVGAEGMDHVRELIAIPDEEHLAPWIKLISHSNNTQAMLVKCNIPVDLLQVCVYRYSTM